MPIDHVNCDIENTAIQNGTAMVNVPLSIFNNRSLLMFLMRGLSTDRDPTRHVNILFRRASGSLWSTGPACRSNFVG